MNLLKALVTVSGMTMISRVLGFVRDAVIARAFGAGLYTDAFFVAFKLPNLLRRVFAEGAFSQAFVPVLAEYKEKRGEADTRELLASVTGVLALALVVVTALGMLAAPWVIWVTAPGFVDDGDKAALTASLLRITFPYILFISLASLASSVLNTFNRFSIPAFTPTLLNVSFIIFAAWLAPYFDPPVMALGWAVFAGGILQLAFQLPALRRLGMLPRPRLNLRDSGVRRIVTHMGPAIFAVSISQISLVINTIFASFLVSGSVSWMYYADRLMEFPTGVLGVALGTILLPSLSRHAAGGNPETFSRLLDWGIRLSVLLAVPCAVGLAVMAEPLIATLFMYGKFTAHDMDMTRMALLAYAVGLLGLILVKVLAPGFYARQNLKTPVKIALITLTATQLMNLALIGPLKHAGLALSIGLAACLNAGLLLRQLRVHGIYRPQAGWAGFVLRVGLAVGGMTAFLLAGLNWLPVDWHGAAWLRAGWLTLLVGGGAGVYFGLLFACGFRLRDFVWRESLPRAEPAENPA
ncbi:murein biosynthesis integral membrane protein MurJ [Laribacter hongkongensis]|uniref:murein biosynthesis integral membrane protein MurJ n=1 Tax=Laribacter hongkongensis TaxID=168471 RepID=UPI001EFE6D2A|nr:murein biosynthesis integral membrane protein MurJ [Laribacter hongkongensis]MCG9059259.1 murein biosynthesis integral membrane protein MurJ [Laribacter hongkongensis]MCG9085714.1 murein biosynthesis integral membrane protein MurJ [Laribacter hongkongensis]